ncbi:GNAT family N-acetyltransferase [Chitinibacter sp. SCUT-21]|uniref:GNAT family N-acetyltransferase n=1 Tax=Chitinibacter sp. SCUT-21 TaxID=2970891 RepID=UPI0035A58114
MRISMLTAADMRAYRSLMLEAYEVASDAFTSTVQERELEPDSWWIKRLSHPTGLSAVFGAFIDQQLVGTVALEFTNKPKTRHKSHLIGMYVRPEARRAGAGRKLVTNAIAFAKARPDTKIITLTVTNSNAPAQSLYESLGFKSFGLEPMAIRTADGYLDKVHMSLRLNSSTAGWAE